MSDGMIMLNDDQPFSAEQFQEFETGLKELISSIFNPEIPFTQTDDETRCTYCAFKEICGR